MSDPESLLRAALESQAHQGAFVATPASRVAGAAQRIRRRRQAVAAGFSAAAVAAVIVVPIVVSGRPAAPDPSPAPPPVATPTTSTTGEQGYRPRIGYLADDTYYASDGETVELPAGDPVVGVHALEDVDPTTLVVTRDPGTAAPLEWSYLADGNVVGDVFCTGSIPVVGNGSKALTFTTRPCAESSQADEILTFEVEGQPEPERQPIPQDAAVVAGEFGYTVLNSPAGGVLIARYDPFEGEGTEVTRFPELTTAWDLNTLAFEAGAVSGLLDDGAGAVVTLDGDIVWERSELEPLAFSPDGRRLLAREPGRFSVVGARNGRTQVSFDMDDSLGRLTSVTWDDNRNLIGVVSDASANQSLARLGIDGSVTPLPDAPVLGPEGRFVFDNGPPPDGNGPL